MDIEEFIRNTVLDAVANPGKTVILENQEGELHITFHPAKNVIQ